MNNGAGTNALGRFGGRASGNRSTENGGSVLPDALGSLGFASIPAEGAPLGGGFADAFATGNSGAAVPTVAMPAFGLAVDGSAQSDGSAMTGPAGATVAVNSRGVSTPGVAVDASGQSDGSAMTGPAGASVAVDNGGAAASSVSLVASEPDTVTAPGHVGASTGTISAPTASTAISTELPSNGLTASVTAS